MMEKPGPPSTTGAVLSSLMTAMAPVISASRSRREALSTVSMFLMEMPMRS